MLATREMKWRQNKKEMGRKSCCKKRKRKLKEYITSKKKKKKHFLFASPFHFALCLLYPSVPLFQFHSSSCRLLFQDNFHLCTQSPFSPFGLFCLTKRKQNKQTKQNTKNNTEFLSPPKKKSWMCSLILWLLSLKWTDWVLLTQMTKCYFGIINSFLQKKKYRLI